MKKEWLLQLFKRIRYYTIPIPIVNTNILFLFKKNHPNKLFTFQHLLLNKDCSNVSSKKTF